MARDCLLCLLLAFLCALSSSLSTPYPHPRPSHTGTPGQPLGLRAARASRRRRAASDDVCQLPSAAAAATDGHLAAVTAPAGCGPRRDPIPRFRSKRGASCLVARQGLPGAGGGGHPSRQSRTAALTPLHSAMSETASRASTMHALVRKPPAAAGMNLLARHRPQCTSPMAAASFQPMHSETLPSPPSQSPLPMIDSSRE